MFIRKKLKIFINIFLIILFFNTILVNSALADLDINNHKGFSKGVSYKPIVPIKKITFVNHNEDNLIGLSSGNNAFTIKVSVRLPN